MNRLHSSRAKNKLESHKKECKNKDFCNVMMPSKDTKILEFNQYHKPDKAPFIIYPDLESLIGKIDGRKIDLKFIYNKSKQTYFIRFFHIYIIAIQKYRK